MSYSRVLAAATGLALLAGASHAALAADSDAAGDGADQQGDRMLRMKRTWWQDSPLRAIPIQAQGPAAVAPPPPSSEVINYDQPMADASKPGVLTRKGVVVIEPTLEYQHTNLNSFVAGGVAILDTVLVGNIQATQSSHDAYTYTLGMRVGITDRLEGELRLPVMYRDDSVTNTVVSTNTTQSTQDTHNVGLGDIEGAVHYQVNDGDGGWPIFVTNLRVKSDSGVGPFDISRNSLGVPTEGATGSGFWGVEPSVTLIAPSDPAVFFANAGYLYNIGEDVNKAYNSTININSARPGGAYRFGMGMGLALNDKTSFSIGYQHDFIDKTKVNFSNSTSYTSPTLSVGTLNFGVNWQMNDRMALNVNVGIGVTSDAPDVHLMARLPLSLAVF